MKQSHDIIIQNKYHHIIYIGMGYNNSSNENFAINSNVKLDWLHLLLFAIVLILLILLGRKIINLKS